MAAIAAMPDILAPIFAHGDADRIALCCGSRALSFGELRGAVAAMRDSLAARGVRDGDRVAVCLPKSLDSVIASFGALAAGAAYVPLDQAMPAAQLAVVIGELRPRLIIATPSTLRAWQRAAAPGSLPPAALVDARTLRLVVVDDGVGGEAPAMSPGLAAILYTSGSTGVPKGVMLSHANVASFVAWGLRSFAIGPNDRVINHAPLHFDLSIFDLFCGLGGGASVHLVDETTARFPGAVRRLVESAGITVWYSAPSALVRLQQRRALHGIASLRLILFAGEVFPTPILRQLMADLPWPAYANLFGPTETNVCTLHRLPGPPESDAMAIPIGEPCDHQLVRLLDDDGRDVPDGVTGEICVAGPAVTQGYWARPDLTTAARVLAWRADSYRTGDYAWRRGDGALMFAGRRDQQVKLRGHRVELLALEAVLCAHPGIREAAAVYLPNASPGHALGGALGAALVADGPRLSLGAIRAFVAERLPEHHAPTLAAWLDELPRLSNGKVDRARVAARFAPTDDIRE